MAEGKINGNLRINDGTDLRTLKELNEMVNTLSTNINNMMDKAYPVGSIYMSFNSTSPASLFGGTWETIEREIFNWCR